MKKIFTFFSMIVIALCAHSQYQTFELKQDETKIIVSIPQSSVAAGVDINNDGNFKDNDAYDQYNWYVLTSFNTFSAANSFAAIAKELGAQTIGQKTGGGMCSVMPIVLPDQTTIEMSSNNAQLSKVGDKLELIEAGVNPDITINYSDFYNLNTYENLLN